MAGLRDEYILKVTWSSDVQAWLRISGFIPQGLYFKSALNMDAFPLLYILFFWADSGLPFCPTLFLHYFLLRCDLFQFSPAHSVPWQLETCSRPSCLHGLETMVKSSGSLLCWAQEGGGESSLCMIFSMLSFQLALLKQWKKSCWYATCCICLLMLCVFMFKYDTVIQRIIISIFWFLGNILLWIHGYAKNNYLNLLILREHIILSPGE